MEKPTKHDHTTRANKSVEKEMYLLFDKNGFLICICDTKADTYAIRRALNENNDRNNP